MGEKH